MYLIEAILRGRLYFAGSCKVEVDDDGTVDLHNVRLRILGIAEALQSLDPSVQRSLALDDFLAIKGKFGLSFPGHFYESPEGAEP